MVSALAAAFQKSMLSFSSSYVPGTILEDGTKTAKQSARSPESYQRQTKADKYVTLSNDHRS